MNRKIEIRNNLENVKERIAVAAQKAQRDLADITLVVVTKTFEVGDLEILYALGEREFGENRDQEASKKAEQLPEDINWHFQGQIQSNKLKSICKWADFIHSVDQFKYAKIISDQCQIKPMSIFLQVSLDSPVESRGGIDPIKLENLASEISELPGVSIAGLMAVAPLGIEADQAFKRVQMIHSNFKHKFPQAKLLSAGMSGDFETALLYGATHLRIGSSILGNRYLSE
ncbi:MAG: YggS family pyridoxal phosphate-dependent enzyme [Actinobacteria bacterium]|nr:YggS family pyridoxal phosphate-dependent enzyme [Actinomycetota bacterium]